MSSLPENLYSVDETRQLEQIAIQQFQIPAYTLMTRAAQAVLDHIQMLYPLCRRLLICCGAGNNAGDGYVLARLAKNIGLEVHLLSMVDVQTLTAEAGTAYKDWKSLGLQAVKYSPELIESVDVVVDALVGTGLIRDLSGEWRTLIENINRSKVPVVSIDIPSGLDANTGTVKGTAVKADSTVSFITLKKGQFTHQAKDYCGAVVFQDLGLDKKVFQKLETQVKLLNTSALIKNLPPRLSCSHKMQYGHVLLIGGDYGLAGAIRLAAESALRAGAGLVTVLTRAQHVNGLLAACPELMVMACDDAKIPQGLLSKVSCIVIGPGLGQSRWASKLLAQVLQTHTHKVLDADALNLLTQQDGPRDDWVLTPHPGEAAVLLNSGTEDIQNNRYTSASLLQQSYGGVVILKGSGSIVECATHTRVCPYGNPGMASAGMGDVLSGVVAAFIAQGLSLSRAAEMAVLVHAKAGDLAAGSLPRGLLASDLFAPIRQLINPAERA